MMYTASINLISLSDISPFLLSWVDKSPDLDVGGIFLNFENSEAIVHRLPVIGPQTNSFAGIGAIKFEHNLKGEFAHKILVAPLHKLIQAIKWDVLEKNPTSISIDEKGQTYIITKGNTIFLSSEWRNISSDSFSGKSENTKPLFQVKGLTISPNSAFFALKQILKGDDGALDNLKKKLDFSLKTEGSENELKSLISILKKNCIFDAEVLSGRINPNLTYFKSPIGKTIVSYSRTSSTFVTLDSSFPDSFSLADESPESMDVGFARDMQSLIKLLAQARSNEPELQLFVSTHKYEHQVKSYKTYAKAKITGEDKPEYMHIFSIRSSDSLYSFSFIVPSTIGMAPPTEDDINMIVPQNLWLDDFSEGLFFSVDKKVLFDTLEFWDQLSKTESKDNVTPLRPIQLEIKKDEVLSLKMNSSSGGDSSADLPCVIKSVGTYEEFLNKPFFIPLDPFLRILESPLFFSDSDEEVVFVKTQNTLTFKTKNEETNKTAIAILAEFVQ